MGAAPFTTYQPGADPAAAFDAACTRARDHHGHDGYTATIAEKTSYEIITNIPQSYRDATALAQQLIADDDDRITDTRGPAGAIPVKRTSRHPLVSHAALTHDGHDDERDAETLSSVTDRARTTGLIGEDETVTAARRYDDARTTTAAPNASGHPDGWLFFGWARE